MANADAFTASRRAVYAVAALAAALSLVAFLYFFSRGMTNHYGDGVAHVNIARKVVDHPDASLWQRYIQIGSPWLPLQTVAIMPFVANDWMWRTGAAGSLASMLSFVITAVFVFQHARRLYGDEPGAYATALPWLAAGIFLLNPSALFMQTTPMSEMVFMAALAAGVYLLQHWADEPGPGRLAAAGVALTLATLARYEAWPVAALAGGIVALAARDGWRARLRQAALFGVVVATGPLYWLWHNWAIFGHPLWFLIGPSSARGIYEQNRANLGWSQIFVGNALLDLGLMVGTVAACSGLIVALLGGVGFLRLLVIRRSELLRLTPSLLLVVPFFFHVFSLYRGEIQIFPLSAFGLLNVRYGLPHLLAIALFAPGAVLLLRRFRPRAAPATVGLLVAAQYVYLISDGPAQLAVYQEGFRNGVNARPARHLARLSAYLRDHPPPRLILMETGALGTAVTRGGLRFADIIHEGTLGWHAIADAIPPEISTIILQEGDAFDRRLRDNPALLDSFTRDFEERFAHAKMRVYARRSQGLEAGKDRSLARLTAASE